MNEFWNAEPSSGELTLEALEKNLEAIKNAPPDPCSLGRHVVSADAFRLGWTWATCGNCYRPVSLPLKELEAE